MRESNSPIHPLSELVFEVTEEIEGGYSAECLTENIFTQGHRPNSLQDDALAAQAGQKSR